MGFNKETKIYTVENKPFVNTREFTRTAQYFTKYGVYTKAHPKYDRREYEAFWDEEERRRREGYSVGGVHITGEHYGFLNFSQIFLTNNPDEATAADFSRATAKKVDFPRFWDGHYHWFTAKKVARDNSLHILGGKSRRKGFSYVGGWSAANNYDLYPRTTTIIGAFDNKYLIKGDGTMSMAKKNLDFLNKHTDWYKGRLTNTKDEVKSGYKIRGRDEEYGFLSRIIAVSFKDNADAAAGKDAYEVDLEELGIFPNLNNVLDITLPVLESGDLITGQAIGWGTGGTKDANWEVFEEIFYHPLKHRFMAFQNIWDENVGNTTCGFFFPYKQNLEGISEETGKPLIDEDGNSDLEAAAQVCEIRRAEKKANTTDVNSYSLWVGQRANCPSEAFSRSIANIFTRQELKDQIHKVKHDPNLKYLAREGIFVRTSRGVRFVTNPELEAQGLEWHPPVGTFPPQTDGDMTGCYVEWQPPYRDPKTGKIPKGLYRIWNDPYAHDKDTKSITQKDSLGSAYIYERPNTFTPSRGDIIIGGYVGRPNTMDEYNTQLLLMCEYCGGEDGILLFENDRGDVKPFFTRMKSLHMLADEPDMLHNVELQSGKTGRAKGIMINPVRKGTGAIYLRDWLYNIRGTDEEGNRKLNLHYIYDLGLLQELEKWNLKGNFDRASCMIVGQYDMKEEFEKEIMVAENNSSDDWFNRKHF